MKSFRMHFADELDASCYVKNFDILYYMTIYKNVKI